MAGSRSAPHLGKQRARRNHGLEKGCHHNENEPQTQNSKKTPTAPFPIQISTLNVDKAFQEAGEPSQPDLVQSSEPQTSRIRGHRDRSFPISVAAVTPNPPPGCAGGGECRERVLGGRKGARCPAQAVEGRQVETLSVNISQRA